MSSSSKLMDTEPGGEQTQYEGINTFNKPHARQDGSLGDSSGPTEAEEQAKQESREEGDRTAEKIRYGQTMSEGGMSGFTTGQTGEAKQDTFGRTEAQDDEQSDPQTRSQQGYGDGSNVGA